MLKDGKVATRIPVQDLQRARTFTQRSWVSNRAKRDPEVCSTAVVETSPRCLRLIGRPRLSGSTGGKSGPVPCFLSRGTDRNTRGG